jgi:HPr kinase/phosphorylase
MYLVEDLYLSHAERLGLELVAGSSGIKRQIKVPEAHRPGIALTGYLNKFAYKRILIFGKVEIEYLRDLSSEVRRQRLGDILEKPVPAVFLARGFRPPKELLQACEKNHVPLFRAQMPTMALLNKLTLLLTTEFSPSDNVHGTLVEVFGVGLLIQGESAVGKSEAALGLIERGHRLISDDIVHIKKREGAYLEGSGAALTKHHMEIRGIGIINVKNLYGAVCVRDSKSIDIVVELEKWDDLSFYDRIGLEEKESEILGFKLPHHVLPVKPGRDVVLLLETIALNHRLKQMGYNSAKEFNSKLLEQLSGNNKLQKRKRLTLKENSIES